MNVSSLTKFKLLEGSGDIFYIDLVCPSELGPVVVSGFLIHFVVIKLSNWFYLVYSQCILNKEPIFPLTIIEEGPKIKFLHLKKKMTSTNLVHAHLVVLI